MKISKLHWQSDDDVKETKKEDKLIHLSVVFCKGLWEARDLEYGIQN